jgi:antirestriction protein ArdC
MNVVVPSERRDIHRAITESIVAAIEAGTDKSERPWHRPGLQMPLNATTANHYQGVNVVALWAQALDRGYGSNLWASYKQWQEIGAQVRKGERGSMIVFYKRLEELPLEPADDGKSRLSFVARASHVFNAQQVDGFTTPTLERQTAFQLDQQAEAFIGAVGAEVRHGFATACYRHATDTVDMPDRELFTGTTTSTPLQSYYGVLLHELTHWSGAPHRLARDMGKRFGDQAYAMEELVAEIGAAFLCSALGIASEPRPDHAAYVSAWLQVLKQDSKAIFMAASRAQEAFEHLSYLATQPECK